jgi:hypothetical protein
MTEKDPSAPAPSGTNPDAAVLAQSHRFNLVLVQRMPYDLEYIAPQEILTILRLSNIYAVDWSQGLQPRGGREAVQDFLVPQEGEAGPEWHRVKVRVRLEQLIENPEGVWIPDGNIVWAVQVLGLLQRAIEDAIADAEGL